jgi:hypothetical protein
MIYSYLQKKEITDYNNRIAAHFWFHFLYSRLPKPGDVPKVQGTTGDFSVSGSQLDENKTEVNRAKVSITFWRRFGTLQFAIQTGPAELCPAELASESDR